MSLGSRPERIPWLLLAAVLGLLLMGFTGIERGDQLTGTDYLNRQILWALLALPALAVTAGCSYRGLKYVSYPLFGVSLLLLVAVFFTPARNGSHRWIPLGFMNLQPSELAKLTYIFALAQYLMYRRNYRRLTGLVMPFALTMVPVALILKEPDLGTALVFIPILFAMLFAAGARVRHLVLISALGAACLPILWLGMSAEQKSRVVSLFTQQDGGEAPTGDGYHLHQSKQVIALGGLTGTEWGGMAVDDPRAWHLPAGRTDFVFSLISERWGILGGGAVLLCYAILFAQGLRIAASTREPFGRLVCVGVVAMLAAQTVINTGMTVGLMPITGLTLPFVSYGGSSLLSTAVAVGLLVSVSLRPGYEISDEPFRFSPQAA